MTWPPKLLAFLLGSFAAGVTSAPAADRTEQVGEPIQRLHAIRAAYLAVLRTNAVGGDATVSLNGEGATVDDRDATVEPGKTADGKKTDPNLAQWGNFPNFPNFPNWANWNNWFNGWRNF